MNSLESTIEEACSFGRLSVRIEDSTLSFEPFQFCRESFEGLDFTIEVHDLFLCVKTRPLPTHNHCQIFCAPTCSYTDGSLYLDGNLIGKCSTETAFDLLSYLHSSNAPQQISLTSLKGMYSAPSCGIVLFADCVIMLKHLSDESCFSNVQILDAKDLPPFPGAEVPVHSEYNCVSATDSTRGVLSVFADAILFKGGMLCIFIPRDLVFSVKITRRTLITKGLLVEGRDFAFFFHSFHSAEHLAQIYHETSI